MPIYLFWGEEDFNIDSAVKELKNKLLDSSWGAINHKLLEEPDLKTLLEAIETTPMMFGNLVIEVNSTKLFTRGKAQTDEKLTERLIENINSLNPGISIIFVCKIERGSGKKVDSAKKLVKAISKAGEIKEFPVFKSWEENKVKDWIKNRLKAKNLSITNDASSLLVFQTGTDLRKIDTELEKIITYIFPKKEISKEDVSVLCSNTENIFRMTDLWLQNEKNKAVFELKKLFEKNPPVKIAATMQSVLKKWIKIKIESKNNSPADIAKMLGLHPFVVEQEMKKLKNIPIEQLINQRQKLNNFEYKLKTGKIQPELALEMVIAS
jgi:DNA polymerase III subunit delta